MELAVIHEEPDDIGKCHYPQELLVLILHCSNMYFLCPHLDEKLICRIGVVYVDDITDKICFVQFPMAFPILGKPQDVRQVYESDYQILREKNRIPVERVFAFRNFFLYLIKCIAMGKRNELCPLYHEFGDGRALQGKYVC